MKAETPSFHHPCSGERVGRPSLGDRPEPTAHAYRIATITISPGFARCATHGHYVTATVVCRLGPTSSVPATIARLASRAVGSPFLPSATRYAARHADLRRIDRSHVGLHPRAGSRAPSHARKLCLVCGARRVVGRLRRCFGGPMFDSSGNCERRRGSASPHELRMRLRSPARVDPLPRPRPPPRPDSEASAPRLP